VVAPRCPPQKRSNQCVSVWVVFVLGGFVGQQFSNFSYQFHQCSAPTCRTKASPRCQALPGDAAGDFGFDAHCWSGDHRLEGSGNFQAVQCWAITSLVFSFLLGLPVMWPRHLSFSWTLSDDHFKNCWPQSVVPGQIAQTLARFFI